MLANEMPVELFDDLSLDVHGSGAAASRIATLSALDNQDTDLSAFAQRAESC